MLLFAVAEVKQCRSQTLFEHLLYRPIARFERGKQITKKQSRRRLWKDPDGRFGDDPETTLAADQKKIELQAGRMF